MRLAAKSLTERFEIVGCGVDDVTIGFDMKGSRSSIQRLQETPGVASRRGKLLAAHGERGKFAHLLGRSVSFWREETNRLYVQAKLAEEGRLAPLDGLSAAVTACLSEWLSLVLRATSQHSSPGWMWR